MTILRQFDHWVYGFVCGAVIVILALKAHIGKPSVAERDSYKEQ